VDTFLWEKGKMVDLGTLGGVYTYLNGANNRGQVAGYSNLAGDLTNHPFFGDRGGLKDLGTFGGDNGVANWLDDAGEVVGTADFPGDVIHHAFVWKDGVKKDLGTVEGDGCSNGVGINSLGQAVGTSTNCQGVVEHLFLWENSSMLDLSALILPGSNVTFNDPTFINDRAEITGNGTLPNGDHHAVILVPCDENHPHVAGCDYDPVESATTAQSHAAQAIQTRTGSANETQTSPSEMTTRGSFSRASRNWRFGTLPRQ
jgi:probable HAF family extracellular repeat protein